MYCRKTWTIYKMTQADQTRITDYQLCKNVSQINGPLTSVSMPPPLPMSMIFNPCKGNNGLQSLVATFLFLSASRIKGTRREFIECRASNSPVSSHQRLAKAENLLISSSSIVVWALGLSGFGLLLERYIVAYLKTQITNDSSLVWSVVFDHNKFFWKESNFIQKELICLLNK